jgi:hypothetical protein
MCTEPNLYQLRSRQQGITIDYSTSSISGEPMLTVVRGGETHAYRGEEIAAVDSPVGRMVTVTLSAIPDLEVVTLTLVLPGFNLEGRVGQLRTFAVITTHHTSIAGPSLVKGQLQTYEHVALSGSAQQVAF